MQKVVSRGVQGQWTLLQNLHSGNKAQACIPMTSLGLTRHVQGF